MSLVRKVNLDPASIPPGPSRYYNHWTTKEGRVMSLEDMSTKHILNCINMINRQIEKIETNVYFGDYFANPFDEDTEAYNCFEQEADYMELDGDVYCDILDDFHSELERRGYKGGK